MDRDLGFKAGTIWSFERVSHILQAKGAGLARQGCDAQSWCDQYGLELADEHTLSDPGKSAYHAKHMRKGGPLDRFLELADRRLLASIPCFSSKRSIACLECRVARRWRSLL